MLKRVLLVTLIAFVAGLIFWQMFLSKVNVTGNAALTWNANVEEDLAGYRIYYGTEPRKGDCPKDGGYAKKIDAGKNNSYTFTDLPAGETYYFSVTSYNTSGKESCFSPEMSKKITNTLWDRVKQIFAKN